MENETNKKRLFVGGIPYSTTEDELKERFEAIGPVISSKIIMDNISGRSKGFGFVEMETEEAAQQAIDQLNDSEMGSRKIHVNAAKPSVRRR